VRVKLRGAADGCSLKVYSRAWILLQSVESASASNAGWNELAWDRGDLPSGTYYVQVKSLARGGHGVADTKTISLVVLR
jgi:hypothetical protein